MHAILDPASQDDTSSGTITTTLYDLMDAMQDDITPSEEDLVVASVVHLLRSGRITFLGSDGPFVGGTSKSDRRSYS